MTQNTNNKIWFTIHTGTQGFTDQMMQFSPFYKLGLSLGYDYKFTPFVSTRTNAGPSNASEKPADIYDFLGFNQYFQQSQFLLQKDNVQELEIELSDNIVEINEIDSLTSLQEFVRKKVAFTIHEHKPLLVIFRLERKPPLPGKTKRNFFSLIHGEINEFPDNLNLRNLYISQSKHNKVKDLYSPDKTRVLVHIRQGDTSYIETPWGTCIPVDSRREDFLKEKESFSQIRSSYSNNIVDSLFEPEDYLRFVKNLYSYLGSIEVSTLCFSDGYQRAFSILNENSKNLTLSAQQQQLIHQSSIGYDDAKFSIFNELADTQCIIGETTEKLHQLVHSAFSSDIIIVAAQQRMLPKFIANYGLDSKPLVIVLYRETLPDYQDILNENDPRFVYVNIEQPDFSSIYQKIQWMNKHSKVS